MSEGPGRPWGRRVARVVIGGLFVATLAQIGQPASAGDCGVPIVAYFFHGASAPGAPGGRVLVPARPHPATEACMTGAPADAFVVPPGVAFVRAELQTAVGQNKPTYCLHGLGLANRCATSEWFTSSETGVRYAKSDTYALDPTIVTGGFTATFAGYGTQSYRTPAG
ncbi:MAG TPA: hypothetical protein VM840_07705 [Actinomycetota bacterium]|nr:hypothetical protein [Actinomycetota bacterium]